jgi:hypothetical protein
MALRQNRLCSAIRSNGFFPRGPGSETRSRCPGPSPPGKRPGDSASFGFQVSSWISGTTSPHVSPPGVFFAGVVGLLRRSGSRGVGTGWSVAKSGCARPPPCGAS